MLPVLDAEFKIGISNRNKDIPATTANMIPEIRRYPDVHWNNISHNSICETSGRSKACFK